LLATLLALLPFAISMSITPGPNNIMVTASAASFGLWRTLPHLLGISLGFPVMLVAVGIGLGSAFTAYSVLHRILQVLGIGYMLYLAWRMAASNPGTDVDASADAGGRAARPLSFLQAALFQWANPKAWVIALGAVTTYTRLDQPMLLQILVIAGVFAVTAFPATGLWALFGIAIGRLLRSPRALRIFNLAMAALLVLSLLPMLL
jgi:threonine/homoserine/homoserine lactone efflux protein